VGHRSADNIRNKHHSRHQIPLHSFTLAKGTAQHHSQTPSDSKQKKMVPHLSPPGWALSVMAALTIIMQTPNLYNPSAFMAEFQISSPAAAQLIGKPWSYARSHRSHRSSTFNPLYIPPLSVTPKADILSHLAFLLVLINGYDFLGAMQDNWKVYWFSLVARAVAMVFFWTLGEPWNKLVGFEGATFAILGVAMWFA